MDNTRIDRKERKARLTIGSGSRIGRAIRKALLRKTPIKVKDTGLKVTEMSAYDKIYNLIQEEKKRSNSQLDYILKSKEKVMSGATRAFRKGATKAKKTGIGNKGEDKILDVPRTTRGVRRRARKARNKGHVKDAVNAALKGKKLKAK